MIGERLLDLRKDSGLTQQELADILNINKHSVSSYERDKSEPPDAIKIAIAQYFNVSVDYLLGLTDTPAALKHDELVLRLPSDFPKSAVSEVLSYAHYLAQRHKDTNP